MINRGAPPYHQQQMMQQGGGGGGGGGGMGMGQPRMGMGPGPTANNMPQQYNPQQPRDQMAQMQYQQPQQRQHPMNTQSYLGVPDQLKMAPQQQQQQGAPSQQPSQPPAPAKPKEPQGWVCPQCTLVNNPRRPGCELCSAPRPENYVVPEEAPLADFERKAKENEALFEQVKIRNWLMYVRNRGLQVGRRYSTTSH